MDENKETIENTADIDTEETAAAEETAPETAEKTAAEETASEETSEDNADDTSDDTADDADAPEDNAVTDEKAADEEKPEEKKGSIANDIVEILESTLITVFVIVMLFTYILHPVNIIGHSMVPTLNKSSETGREDTDKVFMTTVFFDVKYGDILVIDKDKNYLVDVNGQPYIPENDPPINECIIKRVIATGGQTVDIADGQVIVDGKVLDEPYIAQGAVTYDLGAFTGQFPLTVPKGYYFVMGDNREHSTDSRAKSVGLVKRDQIYGKAIIKYSPISEFDILTDSWKG